MGVQRLSPALGAIRFDKFHASAHAALKRMRPPSRPNHDVAHESKQKGIRTHMKEHARFYKGNAKGSAKDALTGAHLNDHLAIARKAMQAMRSDSFHLGSVFQCFGLLPRLLFRSTEHRADDFRGVRESCI